MFGGQGLYFNGTFFGIVARDRLYLKTDERSRQRYQRLGAEPFQANPKQILWTYYEVPASILEDSTELVSCAQEAIQAQRQNTLLDRY